VHMKIGVAQLEFLGKCLVPLRVGHGVAFTEPLLRWVYDELDDLRKRGMIELNASSNWQLLENAVGSMAHKEAFHAAHLFDNLKFSLRQ